MKIENNTSYELLNITEKVLPTLKIQLQYDLYSFPIIFFFSLQSYSVFWEFRNFFMQSNNQMEGWEIKNFHFRFWVKLLVLQWRVFFLVS